MHKALKRILLAVLIVFFSGLIIYLLKPSPESFFSNAARAKHLIVISVDALNAKDFDFIKNLPNFRKLLSEGSYAREVISVYPSLTYLAHTSVVTGNYPDRYGIYNNEFCQPGVKLQEWYWYSKYIKSPTLWDVAKKNNMKVGALFWPVTAGAKIDYNIPEIWTIKENQNQTFLTIRTGSPIYILEVFFRYGKMLNGTKQPWLDDFATASAIYMIKSKKPNLLLLHLTDLDHARHKHGVMSKNAMDALRRVDERIGKIIRAAKEAGIDRDASFIVFGDHGFLDVKYKIYLNTALRKAGLISIDSSGRVADWKAYANYCEGSAQVVLKDKNDSSTRVKVGQILNQLKDDPNSGIERIYTKREAAQKRVAGDFEYMVEGKKGYYFVNDWDTDELVSRIDPSKFDEYDDEYYAAVHGYDPLKPGYRSFFLAAGSGIRKGIVLPSINLADLGPTLAALLGLDLPNPDGKLLKEIIYP